MKKQRLGAAGEDLATQFLLAAGYQILARNLETRYGEVDIVALVGQTIVAVEVKAKTNLEYGSPAEMLTSTKRHKLNQIATYLAQHYGFTDYRIDTIAILYTGSKPIIEHYPAIL
jgi:putative endonuclease